MSLSLFDESSTAVARGQAPGKVILLGEHVVVYGRPAIAAALDRRVDVMLVPASGNARFEIEDDPRLPVALGRAAELVGVAPAGFVVRVASDLPRAMGLGSSAALSVALLRALASRADSRLSAGALSAYAYEVETIFHGTPSGIDNSAVASGGVIGFRRHPDGRMAVRPLPIARTIPLVVVLGRVPRQTKQVVTALRERWSAERRQYEQWFGEIEWLVADAERAIVRGDLAELGILMNTNHGLLRTLGVSTDELEAMVGLARSAGALGAKLTGGGGGGAVICLCPEARDQLVGAFARAGWHAFITDITDGGRRGSDGWSDATNGARCNGARA
jgi:hydroxymethylglutaryl-CoA reductase